MPLGPHSPFEDSSDPDPNFSCQRLAERVAAKHPAVDVFWMTLLFAIAFDEGYTRSQPGLPASWFD